MASEHEHATTANWVERSWETFRCRVCHKLLLKVTQQNALKPGEAIEIKCNCKAMNYLMGSR